MAHPARIAYIPALDGLRGLAVAAVLLYHADVSWARGGFLGVDAFFVLSGFLITTLLLAERTGTGGIDLGAFWARRARRLLPALFLMLGFVALYAAVFAEPGQIPKIRGDALATLGYVANWHQIFSGESYFDQFSGPSPLRHTWSLAIEEQWYLVWPVVVLLLLRFRKISKWTLGLTIVTLGIASAVLMAVMFEPGTDPSRPYYGTDTRVQSLLVGAGLALLLVNREQVTTGAPRMMFQTMALCCAGFVAWLWVTSAENSEFLYRGGLAASAVAVAVVIAAARDERSIIGRALSLRPLIWLGIISYGVYLWHWPIYLTLTEERTGLDGNALLGVRLGVTLAVAAASYYVVEMPVRRGVLPARVSWAVAPATAAVLAIALVLVTRGGGTGVALPGEAIDVAQADAILQSISFAFDTPTPAATATPRPRSTVEAATSAPPQQVAVQPQREAASTATPKPTASAGPPLRVLLLGDSVASTLAQGLYPFQERYNFKLFDATMIGCSFIAGDVQVSNGEFAVPEEGCRRHEDAWRERVTNFAPDIVVLLPGLWDAHNHRVNGQVLVFGTAPAREHWLAELRSARDVLSSQGARVVFLTTPFFPPEAYIGNDRVVGLNALIRQVVNEQPARASIIDLNGFLYPGGEWVPYINGLNVRGDGYHFSREGAVFVGRWIAPQFRGHVR